MNRIIAFNEGELNVNTYELLKCLGHIKNDLDILILEKLDERRIELIRSRMSKNIKRSIEYTNQFRGQSFNKETYKGFKTISEKELEKNKPSDYKPLI